MSVGAAAVWPVLLPLATAVTLLFWRQPTALRRILAAVSLAAQAGWAGVLLESTLGAPPLVAALGGWAAPHGIVLVVDPLAAVMLLLAALTGLAAALHGFAEQSVGEEHPLRLPLTQFLAAGVALAFTTGDLFNLFVAFEVTLVTSYALLTLEADDRDVRQAFPYLALNLVGSALFLAACGAAYGVFGTLNLAEICRRAPELASDPRTTLIAWTLLVVFGLKAGVFPLYYWLPNAYPILPTPLAALFGGVLTKVGVYVLLRIYGQVLPPGLPGIGSFLVAAGAVTMVAGVAGAVSRGSIRGILSYHILSQIGYMLAVLGLGTREALAAALLFAGHNMLVKASLFLLGGAAAAVCGTDELRRAGGVARAAPVLAALFLVQALSLAGMPPLSGFWGKYGIVLESLRSSHWALAAVALGVSVFTLLSMLKIWMAVFWRDPPDGGALTAGTGRWRAMTAAAAVLVLASLALGLGAGPAVQVARAAADQVLDRESYVRHLLPEVPPGGLAP